MGVIRLKRWIRGAVLLLACGLASAATWPPAGRPQRRPWAPPVERALDAPPARDYSLLWRLALQPPRLPPPPDLPVAPRLPIVVEHVFPGPPASICATVDGQSDVLWFVGCARRVRGRAVLLLEATAESAIFAVEGNPGRLHVRRQARSQG